VSAVGRGEVGKTDKKMEEGKESVGKRNNSGLNGVCVERLGQKLKKNGNETFKQGWRA